MNNKEIYEITVYRLLCQFDYQLNWFASDSYEWSFVGFRLSAMNRWWSDVIQKQNQANQDWL